MQFAIEKIKQHPDASMPVQLAAELDPAAHGYAFRLAEPLRFVGQAENLGAGLFQVQGQLQTTLQLACSRCLEPFPLPLALDFGERYAAEARPDAAGEADIHAFTGAEIDLSEQLLNQIQLALPMQPLCRENCLGLCPRCGTNLNQSSCSCAAAEIDPRWEKLKAFMDDGEKGV